MIRTIFRGLFLVLLFGGQGAFAQYHSGDLLNELHKLQNPVRVLYLAAHPDDENTGMIAWLANQYGAQTAYLSLTRGDGGQNLIGTELGAKLGLLRTQELLQARAIDGGSQYFTRAVDFGYSKTASETLSKWDKDEVLSDVVRVIRQFRPDLILTRFPPDARGGHGHHTASAMLAMEAFMLANDPSAFPEQLPQNLSLWQPTRLYWNSSVWWNKKLDSIARQDPSYVTMEVGQYNPYLGLSINKLAALSRTSHKSQGFGVSVREGAQREYFKYLAGDTAHEDLFEGITAHWARYAFPQGDRMLDSIITGFDPQNPQKSIAPLLLLRQKADAINDAQARQYLEERINDLVIRCLGLHTKLTTARPYYTPGDSLHAQLEILSQTTTVQVEQVQLETTVQQETTRLTPGLLHRRQIELVVPERLSQPYWLREPYQDLFSVSDPKQIGQPENEPSLQANVQLSYAGSRISVKVPLTYRFTDRVEGEITKPVFIVPALTANVPTGNLIFVTDSSQVLRIRFTNYGGGAHRVKVQAPGWQLEPKKVAIPAGAPGSRLEVQVKISPQKRSGTSKLSLSANGDALRQLVEIDYPHINRRMVLEPAAVTLQRPEVTIRGQKVAYLMGAGDEVPAAIRQMGYQVDVLDEAAFAKSDLSAYQAIVAGIRAYNTQKWLPGQHQRLMDYVAQGGNYLVQYNTRSRDLLTGEIGPYPFEISRKRVTEEDAAVEWLLPAHPVFHHPNALSPKDFEGWVQERGLYFADTWDTQYQAPIGWHDTGEETQAGGLLIAHHGKGSFMYTGISFFRQFPAAVPGAYRLLANLLSYQHDEG